MSRPATEPVVIKPSVQMNVGDCAISSLEMLLGIPYAEVLAALPRHLNKRKVMREGLTIRQIRNLAARLGKPLAYRKGLPGEDEVGILDLWRQKPERTGHVAIYARGVVIDPATGLIYTDLSAFLADRNWTVIGFLWREPEVEAPAA